MIKCRNLYKHYREGRSKQVVALEDVSLDVRDGEFYVLLGPSGSGKTTTLRAIAGLEHPDSGSIEMAEELVFSSEQQLRIAPEQRPIAMVFQSYALWPHMNVYNNIAFPLRRGLRRIPSKNIKPRVERAAEILNLNGYLHRAVSQLSGGQQQRVALARAIALEPSVLLMDEPLSNLDARLRTRLRTELKELTSSLGITTVYVTHDQTEAMVMGDRIAVMEAGKILQEGTPTELYQLPNSLAVARFLGDMNLVDASAEHTTAGSYRVTTNGGNLQASSTSIIQDKRKVTLGFRVEDALLSIEKKNNGLPATVISRHYLGEAQLYQLRTGGTTIQARAPKAQVFEPGTQVFVEIDAAHCMLF